MKIQSIQGYNSTNKNQQTNHHLSSPMTSSIINAKNSDPSFGIGVRGALFESIAEGEQILKMSNNSAELKDMAERFHTCPDKIIEDVSSVYDWNSLLTLVGVKHYDEAQSKVAYNKLSKAITNVVNSKARMGSKQLEALNAKAKACYDKYKMYINL